MYKRQAWSTERWEAELQSPGGKRCDAASVLRQDGAGLRPLVNLGLLGVGGHDVGKQASAAGLECEDAMTLTLRVKRKEGGPTPTATEISYVEEPPVANLAALPAPVDGTFDGQGVELPADKTVQSVTGGQSFSTATEITAGTWTDTLVPGEIAVYKIRLEQGQRVQFAMHGPNQGFTYPKGGAWLFVGGTLQSPERTTIGDAFWRAGIFSAPYSREQRTDSGVIRYRNRYATGIGTNPARIAMGGWYYYVASIGADSKGKSLAGVPIAINFTAKVTGTPSGVPEYVTPVANQSPAAAASTTSASVTTATPAVSSSFVGGPSPVLWVGGGAVGLLVIGGGAFLLARRSRRRP